MGVRRVVSLIAAVLLVGACDAVALFAPTGGPYPAACDSLGFSDRRCAAIVERAKAESMIDRATVETIDILPPSREGAISLGGQQIARVRFNVTSQPARVVDFWCTGVGSQGDLACADDPQVTISGGVDHDIPCSGEAPDSGEAPVGCATPPPTPRPAIMARAEPLHVAALDIPLDHVGTYEVTVGTAGLPDGVLSHRSATLADSRPTAFWIRDGIRLEVRPTLPGRPPVGSIYRDPFDGVEPVTVVLVFDVTETTPGAVLQVRDIAVD